MARHPGITKTIHAIAQYYWWPGMKDFITQYIKGCATCQMHKVNTHPTRPPLYPIMADPNALPFQVIALDFVTKLPVSDGFVSILTITGHDCSKASILILCNESITTEGTAELYAKYVVLHYRIPTRVISNQDPCFRAEFTKEICKILGIAQNISSANHPQTDGQSKRTNQSMEQYLQMVTGKDQCDWARWIPLAQYVKNSWVNSTTKKTPYDLILGYTPRIHQLTHTSALPGVTNHMEQLKKHRQEAQEAMKKAQEQLVKESNFKPFQVNDKVWLEGTNLNLPYLTKKLAPRQFGPFRVVTRISNIAYWLELPPTWKIHDSFHTLLLTPYKETEKHGLNFLEPPSDILDGEPEWEVEKLMGH
jgi:hypothetical protein